MKQKHTKYTKINTNKSMHSEMGPQNPIQRTVRTAHLSLLTTVHRHKSERLFRERCRIKRHNADGVHYCNGVT